MKNTNTLTTLGFTDSQAKVYETLLEHPALPARVVARKTGIGRELTYTILEQLIENNLVEKVKINNKVTFFKARHPRELEKFVIEKKTRAKEAESAYEQVIPLLLSTFNSVHNHPHIQFYEGIEGIEKTYAKILEEAKTVYVLRSLFDYENKEVRILTTKQLESQAEKGIRSYVLSPHLPHMAKTVHAHSMRRNITRKVLPKEKLTLPAQIIIWNNKVSITSFKNEIVTTIIESEDISETFRVLFQYMWDSVQ